ncbi:MAG: hypothetical protein QHJ81_15875, partial [Anaerolineae bacterium]|nr:hypothetical protein [Anaerolineae bacterium]
GDGGEGQGGVMGEGTPLARPRLSLRPPGKRAVRRWGRGARGSDGRGDTPRTPQAFAAHGSQMGVCLHVGPVL